MPFVFILCFLYCKKKKYVFPYEFCLLRGKPVMKKVPNVQGRDGHFGRDPQLINCPITFALPVVPLSPNVLICREKGVSRQSCPYSPTLLSGLIKWC